MFRDRVARYAVAVFVLLPAWSPGMAALEATCLAPALSVSIDEVTLPAGTESPVLHLADPNPPAQVSGYNIYRSPVASAPSSAWTLLAFDALDEDAATPGVQWTDGAGDVSPTGVFFYLAAAYNGPCDTEGPWKSPTLDDVDEDGVLDGDDPCPATPAGAPHLMAGCSASDLLIRPELLVDPLGAGIEGFIVGLGAATPPDGVLPNLAEAELSLAAVYDEMQGAMPCMAATSFSAALEFLDAALVAIEDHLATLPTASESTGGSDEWPPPEFRMWSGQHFKLSLLATDARGASDTTLEVCNSQGPSSIVDGVVYAVSDGLRYLQVGDQPMVMGWDLAVQGSGDLAVDTGVSTTVTEYDGVQVATEVGTTPSPFPYLGGLTWDGCLELKILPVQPLPGDPHPQPSWEVHSLDGYLQGGKLELAPGTRLIAADNGCPGIITGGAGAPDVKLDYYYEIYLNYQPKQGNFVNGLNLAHALRGDSPPIHLPEMDPDAQATLIVTQYKNTCVDKGAKLPRFNGQFEQIGNRIWWEDCSGKQAVDPAVSYPLRVRDLSDYCEANYSDVVFDIEDHEPGDWRQTQVVSVTVNPPLVPGPLTFAASGDPLVNGQPQHQGAIGLNQSFGVYNPWGHQHLGRGTNHLSGLDWPHITGTRNGQPFRYPCSVPALAMDSISSCGGNPDAFYRLPFPQSGLTHINQGNGDPLRNGPGSHDSWQEFALDLSATLGASLRAARGGRVVRFRDNFGLNCKIEVDGKWQESGVCLPLSLPLLHSYGNYVAIEHQDGTVAWYAHLLDGSLGNLFVGKKIQRGEPIGQTGNTGSSCGPHLHFHVTATDPSVWLADTERILYQAFSIQSGTVETCIIPAKGEDYLSTNLP